MIEFIKMHGLGNDFAVFDARQQNLPDLTPVIIQKLADRRRGIGFDQLVIIENSQKSDVFMRLYNADGSVTGACGNATRCIARYIMDGNKSDKAKVETVSGILNCSRMNDHLITVDMGQARLGWRDVPLAFEADTINLPISEGELSNPVALSMGNPHAVFFVDDIKAVNLAMLGAKLEHHPIFPERANIGVAAVRSRNELDLRVWERGAGETEACGTGACAAAVAALLRGFADARITVHLPGGELFITSTDSLNVTMTGAAEISYQGSINL